MLQQKQHARVSAGSSGASSSRRLAATATVPLPLSHRPRAAAARAPPPAASCPSSLISSRRAPPHPLQQQRPRQQQPACRASGGGRGPSSSSSSGPAPTNLFSPVYLAIFAGYAALLLFRNPYIYAALTIAAVLPQNSAVTSLNNLVLLFYESGLFANFAEAVYCVRLVTWLSVGFMLGSFALFN